MRKISLLLLAFNLMASMLLAQGFTKVKDTTTKEAIQPFLYKERLIIDAGNWLSKSTTNNNETVMKAFADVWERMLTNKHKDLCFEIAVKLYDRKFDVEAAENFFASVAFAKKKAGASDTQLNRFLEVADTAATVYRKDINARYFEVARMLFEENTLYKRGPEVLVVNGGNFTFGHTLDPELMYEGADFDKLKKKGEWFGEDEAPTDPPVSDETEDEDKDDEDEEIWGEGGEWADASSSEPDEPSPITRRHKPQSKGPVITVTNASMVLGSPRDSLHIEHASGDLQISDFTFVGQEGTAGWASVGLPKSQVYSKMAGGFTIHLDKMTLEAQNALLHYQGKLNQDVEGLFEYENKASNKTGNAEFPRFTSYKSNIVINDYAKDVSYQGGFSLIGKKITSKSFSNDPTMITVAKDGQVKFKLFSDQDFVLKDSVIYNQRSSLVIYQGSEDSITHPGVRVQYAPPSSKLTAYQDKERFKYAPYVSTYHNVEVYGEELVWHVETDSIDINIAQSRDKSLLKVKSNDFFSRYAYTKLGAIYPHFHPIQLAVAYGLKKNTKTLSVVDIAKYQNLNPKIVRDALIEMEEMGYLTYDKKTDEIHLSRKAILYYAANNRLKGIDYDNMRINSLTEYGPNSTFKFDSGHYVIRGVNYFYISDSMQVLVTPNDQQSVIEKNRDTKFSGKMQAGKLLFRGSDFVFDYDSFKVDMATIESLTFIVEDSTGEEQEMSNNITGSYGLLYISKPNNKSGMKPSPNYPRFIAPDGGKITFDGDEILNGAYDERIYFDIPTMDIDSVNSSSPTSFDLEGNFYSSGMFPDFVEQRVSIMPDNSFGFIKPAPPEGFPIFNSTGTFFGEVKLDNSGIRGKGSINYLAGTFVSNDFVYYSDSVKTFGQKGDIKGGIFTETGASYPTVKMDDYQMKWLVNSDSMLLSTYQGNRFRMFNDPKDRIEFDGTIGLTPLKLGGTGILENERTIIKSANYDFKQNDFVANNSVYFKIKSDDISKDAVLGQNVTVDYSLKERKAQIFSENNKGSFSFPYTQYKTTLTGATWDFDKQTVVMTSPKGDNIKLATFTSVNPQQIGLSFEAKDAIYDLQDYKLEVYGIPEILVAGNSIVPDSNHVTIDRDAEMQPLHNATITLNSQNQFHHFYNAELIINSKEGFTGNAKYDFTGGGKKHVFDCQFNVQRLATKEQQDNFKKTGSYGSSTTLRTTATASVMEEDEVSIKSGVRFYGDIKIRNDKKYFEYDGFYAVDDGREFLNWLEYKNTDTTGVEIISDGSQLVNATGLFIDQYSDRRLFGSFAENLGDQAPIMVFTSYGELEYDDNTKIFTVASKEKKEDPTAKGKIYTYHKVNRSMTFEGPLTLLETRNDKIFNVSSAGSGHGISGDESFKLEALNTSLLLTFDPGPAMDYIAESMNTHLTDKAVTDFKSLRKKLVNQLDDKAYEDLIKASRSKVINYADFLGQYFAITDLNLKWSDTETAFYSEGNVGISNIFKNDVNKTTKAYIEIPKAVNNSTIYIFLESGQSWFYLEYEKGSDLKVYSSDLAFRQSLTSKKGKDKSNVKLITDVDKPTYFVNDFRERYLGLEAIDLYMEQGDAGEVPADADQDLPEEDQELDIFDPDPMSDPTSDPNSDPAKDKKDKKDKADKGDKDKKDKEKKSKTKKEEPKEEDGDGGW